MAEWRSVLNLGLPHLGDTREVRDAPGTSGAVTYDKDTDESDLVAVADAAVGASSVWGADSGATAYVDRDRVWLDGFVNTAGASTAVGTLPAGKRPAATVYLPLSFANDQGGTPSFEPGMLSIDTAGVATLTSTASLTGTLLILLTGLSFKVAP